MAGGFITLHRQILEWEWYKNTNTKVLFLHLLLKANYKDLSFEGHTIRRGQLVTSLPSLSAELGMSNKQIRGSLDHLISTGEVTSQAFPRYRVITISKYDEYQNDDSQNGSQTADEPAGKGQAQGSQTAGSGQAKGRQRAASKQYNHINNGTIEQGNTESLRSLSDRFEDFWSAYPRKADKSGAMKAFKKLDPDEELLTTMIIAIGRQKNSSQWLESDGKFVPYPGSWLNHRRWEDEVRPAPVTPAPAQSKPVTKTVSAQQYEQRDYSNEDEEAMMRMLKMGGY